jgi:hypothetical protein
MAQQTELHLDLRTADGQTTFHIGERIPLELSFTGPDNHKFRATNASYDRSGRMNYEKFSVSPSTGWADPLERYLHRSFTIGGGLSSAVELSSKPFVLPLDLNEWVRFDEPGDYTVSVASNRVGPADRYFPEEGGAPLVSNSIRLHVVSATPEWQRAKLAAALAVLDKPGSMTPDESPDRKAAAADIRFLGTPGAIEWMTENLRDGRQDMTTCIFGLDGLPDAMRSVVEEAMNRRLDDPDFPVSSWFVYAMIALERTPTKIGSEEMEENKRLSAQAWQEVLQALPRKNDKARVATAQAAIGSYSELTQQQQAQLSSVLASSFLLLPREKQVMELEGGWDDLNSPAFLPTLRAIVTDPSPAPTKQADVFSSRDLKAAAIRRWYQLDPEGAYQQVLKKIGSATPELNSRELWFLPDKPIPQFESIWADALIKSEYPWMQEDLSLLLVRFGTGAASSSIASMVATRTDGLWSCTGEGVLAYLVKFSPDAARPLVERTLTAREKDSCRGELLTKIGDYVHGPLLTQMAIAALQEEDPYVVMDAAKYLTNFGDKTAKKPVLARLEQWHRKWVGRESELDNPRPNDRELWDEISLGGTLGNALIEGHGWLANQEDFALAERLCLTKQVCDPLKSIRMHSQPPYRVYIQTSSLAPSYGVAQYQLATTDQLDEKLAQFPKGTKFELIRNRTKSSDERAAEEEAAAIFKRNGMTLTEVTPDSGVAATP